MEKFKQKLRAALLIGAVALLVVGLIRAWGHVAGWDLFFVASGSFLLGLALQSGESPKRPLPPAQPMPKSGG